MLKAKDNTLVPSLATLFGKFHRRSGTESGACAPVWPCLEDVARETQLVSGDLHVQNEFTGDLETDLFVRHCSAIGHHFIRRHGDGPVVHGGQPTCLAVTREHVIEDKKGE